MKDLQLKKILKRGDRGGQVKLIQEWLSLHGQHVAIDQKFGPATQLAVKQFQVKSNLDASGIVDDETFQFLIAPITAALVEIPKNEITLGEMVMAYAKQHLAQHPREIGGQNRGPWVRLYMNGKEGEAWPWCAGFVCYCLRQACHTLNVSLPITPSYSCDLLAQSAKGKGRFVKRDKAGPGSLFLVNESANDWVHAGIVVSTSPETFTSIEGNTNDNGEREGYEVCSRTRGYNRMDFILI